MPQREPLNTAGLPPYGGHIAVKAEGQVAAPQVITPRRLPNDLMLPHQAPTRPAGRSQARWRSLYHRGAVLFTGLAAAAAKVERTAEAAGAPGPPAIQQRADTCRRHRSITFPGCEPKTGTRGRSSSWTDLLTPSKAAPAHDHAGSLHMRPHAHQLPVRSALGVARPEHAAPDRPVLHATAGGHLLPWGRP